MGNAQVPLVPGYHGDDQDPASDYRASADEMGYPVLLKAVAGGGGKGMRQVWSRDELAQALRRRQTRILWPAFGNDDMLVEKVLNPTAPRRGAGIL